MNKLYICAAVSAVSISIGAASAAAAVSNVSIKTGTKNLSYTYVIEGDQESAKSIKALFNDFEGVSVSPSMERFEVSSKTDEKDPVYLRLRLTLDSAPEGLEYSPLDYYSFTIKDADGEVLYSTEDSELSETDAVEKEIPLGVFNTSYAEDVRILNIEYNINSEVEQYIDPEYVEDLDVMLVSSLYTSDEDIPAAMLPVATLKPNFEIATKAPEQSSGTTTENPDAGETAAPQASEAPAETEQPKEKKVICGEDIEAGRYVVTGNANVKITTADGDIISETTVTDGTDESIKGVKQFITSIEDGDVITITPISDDIKAVVNFDRTNSGTKSTTASSSTTKNNNSSKTGTSSTAKPTSASKTSSSKTNPKTGDDGYATLSLISLMCVSGGAVGVLEVVKRKKAAR